MPPAPGTPYGQAPFQASGSFATPGQPIHYAGFWLRFVAYIIDGIVISICYVPFFVLVGGMGVLHSMTMGGRLEYLGPAMMGIALLWDGGVFVLSWLYWALLESSSWQATLGKKALGLYVTDMNGQRISFGRASGRFFGKIISGMTLLIGYIMAGFTARKQALHDMIAGTLVMRKL